jgi:transposase InsO family protein
LYLSKQSKLKSIVLFELHATPTVGHSGFTKTYDRVKRSFFWDGMKQDICKFVVECEVCQCNKGETVKSPGTLQPLLIPLAIWKDISMDFITGLPKLGNKPVIMVVVDCLSKYANFCTLPHPFTTSTVAQIFMDQVFKLHGMPHSIVSDRDPTFTSNFWQELFTLQNTQLHLSSAYHPQTDGQTEVFNKCLETYMRCFTSEKQH